MPRKKELQFFLREEFTTAESAPLASPRNCEPGPGTLVLTQNDGQFSISSTRLQVPAQTTPDWGDLSLWSQLIPRSAGKGLFFRVIRGATGNSFVGWDDNQAGFGLTGHVLYLNVSETLQYFDIFANGKIHAGIPANQSRDCAIILRSSGAYILVYRPANNTWMLIYSYPLNAGDVYVALGGYGVAHQIEYMRGVDLPASGYTLWADDYGLASEQYLGSVSQGQTFTHATGEGGFAFEFIADSLPSSGNISIVFRKQNDTNYNEIRVSSAGDLAMYEIVGGVESLLDISAGVVSAGERLVIHNNGDRTHLTENEITRLIVPTITFQDYGNGLVNSLGTGGAISNLRIWPRYLYDPIVIESLDAVRNAT